MRNGMDQSSGWFVPWEAPEQRDGGRIVITGGRTIVVALFVALTIIGVGAVGAHASIVDFSCSVSLPTICGPSTLSISNSIYSASGIETWNANPYTTASDFLLAFNSGTGAISLTGQGTWVGENLSGTFSGFAAVDDGTFTTLTLTNTAWSSLPSAVQTALGSPTGIDTGTLIFFDSGLTAKSVDVAIAPTPEPTSLALFAPGLLGLVAMMRRRRKAA